MTNCGRCHTCGTLLRVDPVGDQLCPHCQLFRRYVSHGYGLGQDASACPNREAIARSEGVNQDD